MKAEKKPDHGHVLTKLLKYEVGDNIDFTIRPTWIKYDAHALIIEPKSFLQKMIIVHKDDMLALQKNKVGLIRTLRHYYFHHVYDETNSSFHFSSIEPEDFENLRVNTACRLLCQKWGNHLTFPVPHMTHLRLLFQNLRRQLINFVED